MQWIRENVREAPVACAMGLLDAGPPFPCFGGHAADSVNQEEQMSCS